MTVLLKKIQEALMSVLPVAAIVVLLLAILLSLHLFTYDLCQLKRISETDAFGEIQLIGEDMILWNTLFEQMISKDRAQQIGFSAAPNPGDHFNLPIPHKRDQLLQI